MSGIGLIPVTFDTAPLREQLDQHPELWNEFDLRTNHPQSPHRELSDIFVRYNAWENFKGDRQAWNGPHEAVWWAAAEKLPAAKQIALDLLQALDGEQLGGVLITKIPAGKQCYPHIDVGWHARHYSKIAVQIASAPGQAFHVGPSQLSAEPGECYFFDNSQTHWVVNDSDEDRITLIVCVRTRGDSSCPGALPPLQ